MIRPLLAIASLALIVGTVTYGLHLHNFNLADYVLPRLEGLEETLSALGRQGLSIEYGGLVVREASLDGAVLELTLTVRNGLPLALRVEGLSFRATCSDHGQLLGEGALSQPVEVPPEGGRSLSIDIHVIRSMMEHVANYHAYPTEQGLEVSLVASFSASLSLSLGGVRVEGESYLGTANIRFRLSE